MPTISLTSFVDFVSAGGRSKLTVVRRTKKQMEDGYGPAKDFYKRIREANIGMHRAGDTIAHVSGVLTGLTDKKKIDNYPHLVKLYFKADKLAKRRIDLSTHLMAVACADQAPDGCVMGVLDVRRSKLITPTVPIDRIDTMLLGEAAYWVATWQGLE